MAEEISDEVETRRWLAPARLGIGLAQGLVLFGLHWAMDSKVFFPKGDQTLQLLNTAAMFLVGFLFRPVGAWMMGLYADRKGRRAALVLSISVMCLGSLIIGLCPGYAAIGPFAPAILVFARILQGISMGGEYGASATYLSEMAGRKNRGFWSGVFYMTLILGQLGAALTLNLLHGVMPEAQIQAFGITPCSRLRVRAAPSWPRIKVM